MAELTAPCLGDHEMDHLTRLLAACPGIREIWLIGSRANGTATDRSDWDFLVFADRHAYTALARMPHLNEPDVDLMVLWDRDNFVKPWPEGDREKGGSLTGWKWERHSDAWATYMERKWADGGAISRTAHAVRIWPESPPMKSAGRLPGQAFPAALEALLR